MIRPMIVASLLLVTSGCALLSRGTVLPVRYFDPEPARVVPAGAPEPQGTGPAVRLGRVRGSPALRERIAHRDSLYEVGFYDERRWTERPEIYVRGAIERTLFEQRRFERATGGPAPTLDVDVLAFEEVRLPGEHAARVELRFRLESDSAVLGEATLRVEQAVTGDRFDDVVAAMSAALDEATDRLADRVARLAPPLAAAARAR